MKSLSWILLAREYSGRGVNYRDTGRIAIWIDIFVWLFKTGLSIFVLAIFIGGLPLIAHTLLHDKVPILSKVIVSLLLIACLGVVIYFWGDIMSWKFMFPRLDVDWAHFFFGFPW